jgi:hypothetical protein
LNYRDPPRGAEAQSNRKFKLCVQFRLRATRDVQVMQEHTRGSPIVPFRNVRWNRTTRPPELGSQAKALGWRTKAPDIVPHTVDTLAVVCRRCSEVILLERAKAAHSNEKSVS